jgi:hypothetical protein
MGVLIRALGALNRAMTGLFDLLLRPFEGMPAWASLLPLAILFTVFALYVFKWTSNQAALDRVKRRIHAGIFEIRLWNDDLRSIARSQAEIIGQVGKQLALTLVPLLWMLIPFAIVIPQLQFRYGYTGLVPGQSTLLEVKTRSEAQAGEAPDPNRPRPEIRLDAPAGIEVETEALWIPLENEMVWRVAAREPGSYELRFTDGSGFATTKTIVASDRVVRRSPIKVNGRDGWGQIAHPAEAPLPADGPIERIEVAYPEAEVNLLGFETHWLIAFVLLTIVFAFALRGPLGVTF